MPSRLDRQKACIPCADAKRRCDKGLPECQRCLDRDVDCRYPQPKRRRKGPYWPFPDGGGSTVYPEAYIDFGVVDDTAGSHGTGDDGGLAVPAAVGEEHGMLDSMVAISMPGISFDGHDGVFGQLDAGSIFSSAKSITIPSTNTASVNSPFTTGTTTNATPVSSSTETLPWFLHPNSWMIHNTNHDPGCVSDIQLEPYINKVRQMLQDWLQHGHNAFIHSKLYANSGLPGYLQDAYITLSAYTHKTPGVKEMVTHITESKMAALAATSPTSTRAAATSSSNPNPAAAGAAAGAAATIPTADILFKLARVQALFIHIFILLFDGSVRQRSKAERHLPLLRRWVREMYDAAKVYRGPASSSGQVGITKTPTTTSTITAQQPRVIWHFDPATISAEQEHDQSDTLWKAWIVTESVRRTYTVVETVTNVYEIMTKGVAECQGGVSLTGRKGAWEADTAIGWMKVIGDGLGREGGSSNGSEEAEAERQGYVSNGLGKRWEKLPLLVEALQPESVMARCSARDVDDFVIMCWSFIVGEERVRSWIERTG